MNFPDLPEINHVQHVHESIVKLWTSISRESDYQHESLVNYRQQLVDILQTIKHTITSNKRTVNENHRYHNP